jgi:TRAP-type C4-dicarboxylate transport system permease small subunit
MIGFNFAKTASHVSANMKIPMGFLYNVVSVAFVLLVFQAIVSVLNLIKGKEE